MISETNKYYKILAIAKNSNAALNLNGINYNKFFSLHFYNESSSIGKNG